MTRIYFANKGHTRKAKCTNLWPVKGSNFARTPKWFFDTPGIVVYIDPKLEQDKWFRAEFALYDTRSVVYAPAWDGKGEFLRSGCIMTATYNGIGLYIRTSLSEYSTASEADKKLKWMQQHDCIQALEEALPVYLNYFPAQT